MKNILSLLFVFFGFGLTAQITLTHNVGSTPIATDMISCEYSENWGRIFRLSDFGILANNKFIINSGQVAIFNSLGGSDLQFNIYKINNDLSSYFYSRTNLIGSSQKVPIPVIGVMPEVVNVIFDSPIVIPEDVELIFVEVKRLYDVNKRDTSAAYIAGTEFDLDTSWYEGCNTYGYTSTVDLAPPISNANFFINLTGELYDASQFGGNTILTHNLCDDVINVNQYSCSWGGLKYSRTFSLVDFGVSNNEEFIIDRGQVGLRSVGVHDAKIQFNIYKIDDNFPDSYSETDLIGSSQIIYPPSFSTGGPRIFEVIFGSPIVVPANVNKILVEVYNLDSYSSAGLVFIAGGAHNSDVSWLRSESSGCPPFREYEVISRSDINYFITVTGKTRHVSNNFEMNISNICSEFLKEFSVENKTNVASVVWDFGDPASGLDNTSTDVSPFHDFSQDGTYTITATVTGKDTSVEVLSETIDVKEPPSAYGINNIYACEDDYGTGISSSFDTTNLLQQVLGAQTNKVVTFIDGSGNEYTELSNPFTNTIKKQETITVRVAHSNNPCCYSEITFDLIVNPKPNLQSIEDLIVCENNTSGFAFFDLETVKESVINNATNLTVSFYHENGIEIQEPLNAVENIISNEEVISVHVTNIDTNCYNEATFKLKVNPLPVANPLQDLIGCDDNNDGVSEYFDTSNIESQVLGNQAGMDVSYFDISGNPLQNPLPNPYTNTTINQEIITVRVTNPVTDCYEETSLVLKTSTKPQINQPQTMYACDEGSGLANFETASIETQIIGNQTGLKVFYFDGNGSALPSPLPTSFQNSIPWFQTIHVKVENELNSLCYSETSFDLIVNDLPSVNIEDAYFLCSLEPSLNINVENNFDNYKWSYQDGSVVSNTFEVNLVDAGDYMLTVGKSKNGIYCENSFEFELIRSELPNIVNVAYKELSDANYIEIKATGDGDFEYSIDGMNYQNSNLFNNVSGGVYNVSVRDKLGCGEDFNKVTIIDYPKYFTPNNDGINDFWHIKGIQNYPNATVFIYDRYGKLLKQITPDSFGWDGTYNNKKMNATDYWFTVNLDNENKFTGHFSLRR